MRMRWLSTWFSSFFCKFYFIFKGTVINGRADSNDNRVMDLKGVEGVKIYRELMKSRCRYWVMLCCIS